MIPIPGFPGYYATEGGEIWSDRSGILKRLKPWHNGNYLQLSLRSSANAYHYSVHELILLAFVGPRPEGMEGCHCDGDSQNNRISNLRWDTPKANRADKLLHKTLACGSTHGMAKLTESQVLEIRDLYSSKTYSQRQLAERFGVKVGCILNVVNRKSWTHI